MWTEVLSFTLSVGVGIYITNKYLNQNNFTLSEEIVGKVVIDMTENKIKTYVKGIFGN